MKTDYILQHYQEKFDYSRAAHRIEMNINCQSTGTKYPKIQCQLPHTLYFNISFINFVVENEHLILASKLLANETMASIEQIQLLTQIITFLVEYPGPVISMPATISS